ncbi:MAG TPA: hypothetical protein VGI27_00510 [Solirubrobacteraceae bacterium]
MTLRRSRTFAIQLLVSVAAVAIVAFFTFASPSAPPHVIRFVPATLGDQPPGAVVLGREDGDLAVGLAVAPRGSRLLLVATVFGQSGAGVGRLESRFEVATSAGQTVSAAGSPCTPGCYQTTLTASGRPASAAVIFNRRNRVRFTLPARWPAPSGLALVRDAEAEYARLRTLVTHERLASDPTNAVYTTYYAVAPDRLRFQVRGGVESIIIGSERWDRQPGGSWQRSPQAPIEPIKPYWTPLVQDARIVGSAIVDGRPCWVIAFANPQTPGFFTIWLDKVDHRTLQLEMTAAAHFMHHTYGPFNAPFTVEPPTAG